MEGTLQRLRLTVPSLLSVYCIVFPFPPVFLPGGVGRLGTIAWCIW